MRVSVPSDIKQWAIWIVQNEILLNPERPNIRPLNFYAHARKEMEEKAKWEWAERKAEFVIYQLEDIEWIQTVLLGNNDWIRGRSTFRGCFWGWPGHELHRFNGNHHHHLHHHCLWQHRSVTDDLKLWDLDAYLRKHSRTNNWTKTIHISTPIFELKFQFQFVCR